MLVDDTGGEFTGWPSIEAPPEADAAIVHRCGFKQEHWGDLSLPETLANARLIAIAPELYAALRSALDAADNDEARYVDWEAIRGLLTKARGDL